jgi:hypothetical protein
MFENRMPGIFGLKGGEISEDWRRLQNEELHNVFSLSNITG